MHKIVVLGDGGVGKSCITIQFTQNHFVKEYDPTIENSYRKQVTIDDESIMLDILDTAGQEEYSVMRDQYINSGQGFLIVYSVTARRSFETAGELRDKILQVKEADEYPIVLCGNKCDLEEERKVSLEEGTEKAKEWDVPFFETSAKTRVNIEESFFELVRVMRKAEEKPGAKKKGGGPQRPEKKAKKKSSPCTLL